MKQHYLPRFYLRHFSDPRTPVGQKPYVWVYQRGTVAWRKRAPENLAFKSNMYSYTDAAGETVNDIEEWASVFEGRMAKIMRNRLAVRRRLSEEERIDVAVFVAHLFVRVPAMHKPIASLMKQLAERWLGIYSSNTDAFAALKTRYEEQTGETFPEDFGPQHLDPSKYRIKPSMTHAMGIALTQLDLCASFLLAMDWVFLTTRHSKPFITSDVPVCMVNPSLPLGLYGPGFAQSDVEVSVPLSDRVALLARWRKDTPHYMKAPPELIGELNCRTIAHADEFIISSRQEFGGAQLLLQWRESQSQWPSVE